MEEIKRVFTSESVTEGHPDKVCDRIADAILDATLAQDAHARVACEVAATTDFLLIMGEISAHAQVDAPAIARRVIRDVGYCEPGLGFDADGVEIVVKLDKQSPDIAQGVDCALETRTGDAQAVEVGAGDQGMMFGFASDETPELMPMAITLSHALTRRLAEVRKAGVLPYLRPDGKAQVSVGYGAQGQVVCVTAVVLSTQHAPDVEMETLRRDVKKWVIDAVIPAHLLTPNTRIYVNPTGRFVVGGPHGDSGVTGRKIIVDTYGGYAAHGGGAFSGKDPTKVDRSASYYVRYVAKNIVAAGLAKRVQVQVAYAIGKAQPVSVCVDTFGTGKVGDDVLARAVTQVFDFRPAAIIRALDLRRPQYEAVCNYGHFGRSDRSWERTDKTEELLGAVK